MVSFDTSPALLLFLDTNLETWTDLRHVGLHNLFGDFSRDCHSASHWFLSSNWLVQTGDLKASTWRSTIREWKPLKSLYGRWSSNPFYSHQLLLFPSSPVSHLLPCRSWWTMAHLGNAKIQVLSLYRVCSWWILSMNKILPVALAM